MALFCSFIGDTVVSDIDSRGRSATFDRQAGQEEAKETTETGTIGKEIEEAILFAEKIKWQTGS